MSGPVNEAIARAKASGDWGGLVQAVPYFRFLRLGVEVADGRLRGVMRPEPHHVGNPTLPALHGGTLGALLEATAQLELLYRAQTVVMPKTITLTVDYLRSGKVQDVWAEAVIRKQGRRVTTVAVSAWQESADTPIATATVHLLILGA